jgi:acyl carrier protein
VKLNLTQVHYEGLDDLGRAVLFIEFEEEFKITIPDGEVNRIKTVSEVIDYISKVMSNSKNLIK